MTPSRTRRVKLACTAAVLGLMTAAPPLLTRAAESARPENLLAVVAGIEATPVAGLHFTRRRPGLVDPLAETTLAFTTAPLTRLGGGRLRLERDEALLRSRRSALRLVLGGGFTYATDSGGTYLAGHAVVGARATIELGRWELGLRLAYLPVIVGHVGFSSGQRDTFAERYPEARGAAGPTGANVWLPGQRLEAVSTARATFGAWTLGATAGLEGSPAAGRNWSSLELGQQPLVLKLGVGRNF